METLQARFATLAPVLTERSRRLWAATEALALGRGGIALVERATGISRSTVVLGIREVNSGETLRPGRTRRSCGGRKPTVQKDRMLAADLEGLVEPTACGGPDAPLRRTSKSMRRLAEELTAMGHMVSHRLVADLLNASCCQPGFASRTRQVGCPWFAMLAKNDEGMIAFAGHGSEVEVRL